MRHFNVNFFKFILFTYNVNAYVNDDANLWKKSESTTAYTHIATYEKFTIENRKNPHLSPTCKPIFRTTYTLLTGHKVGLSTPPYPLSAAIVASDEPFRI